MSTRWFVKFVMVVLCMSLFAGCGKVTKEKYDKIQSGMTLKEVESILGSGHEKGGGGGALGDLSISGKVVTWGSDEKQISITFVNDKVTVKTMKGL